MVKHSTTDGKLGLGFRKVAFVDTWWRKLLRHESVLYLYGDFCTVPHTVYEDLSGG